MPEELIELLPAEVAALLPEDDEDLPTLCGGLLVESPLGSGFMKVEDIFVVRGRGITLYGTMINGKCKGGDKVTLLDEDGNTIAETTISAIECGQKVLQNLDDYEATRGMEIGLLVPLKTRKEVAGVVSVVIRED